MTSFAEAYPNLVLISPDLRPRIRFISKELKLLKPLAIS
jgi:hypothetical protein